jgi:hypothetical protein
MALCCTFTSICVLPLSDFSDGRISLISSHKSSGIFLIVGRKKDVREKARLHTGVSRVFGT